MQLRRLTSCIRPSQTSLAKIVDLGHTDGDKIGSRGSFWM
jgi:hypothetical protein